MRDDYLDRSWADHHHQIGTGIDKVIASLLFAMERLTAQQFNAPWRAAQPHRARAPR
ncbi:MAG: hypothetical protein M3R41_07150 [Pseudomonadota bacterium]|nr:hypothetical protein [Pseudomonadota bacterium]